MNNSHRNSQIFSRQVEDASEEGLLTTSNRSIGSRQGLLGSAVKAVAAMNNMLMENCSICTMYCDKQVQYEEYVQQQYDLSAGAMGHLYSQLNGNTPTAPPRTNNQHVDEEDEGTAEDSAFINHNEMKTPPNADGSGITESERIEVEKQYREFLFDEDSVVRSVGSRGAFDDEE